MGSLFNAIAWPTAILLMSLLGVAACGPSTRSAPASRGLPAARAYAAAGLAVLFVGSVHDVDLIAVGLATATLLTVGVRMGMSVRRLRALTEERHRQAMTDELTGLGTGASSFHLRRVLR